MPPKKLLWFVQIKPVLWALPIQLQTCLRCNSCWCDMSQLRHAHWDPPEILFYFAVSDKGIFIIQSENLEKCIQASKSTLTLENCKPSNKYMLWKWVSNHHLFNIGGSGCLGLNVSSPEQPLSIYECDSTHVSLKWHCNKKTITGPLQYMVQVKQDNTLVASRKYLHKWVSYMSGGGGICDYLHKGKK